MTPITHRGRWALVAVASLTVLAIASAGYVRPVAAVRYESGRAFHASPAGTVGGDGSPGSPLTLAVALSAQSPVLPGDTLWLHGGTYAGSFVSELRGTEALPITVRQAAGERATIDSGSTSIGVPTLYIKGAWTTYWGFEVMSSNTLRVIAEGGSQPASLRRGMGIDVHAPFTKLVNLVVHDLGDGIGIWADAEGAEADGNLVYYNGWSGADRAHGHGIYTQNQQGTRRISDNIIFSQFSHGIHAYGSDSAPLDRIELTGNIVFNNGALDPKYFDRNILLGGQRVAASPVVDSNYTYYTPGLRHGGENNIGYNAGCTALDARRNYFAGQAAGGVPLRLSERCTGVIRGNVFYGPMESKIAVTYPDNDFVSERPTGTRVFVRPLPHDRTRAHIAIYNWDRLPEVSLDLSSLPFDRARPIELRDAQNYFGPPVYAAAFGNGRITLPMRGRTVAPPIGNVAAPPHTAPEFMALVAIGVPRSRPFSDFAAGTMARVRAWGQGWTQ